MSCCARECKKIPQMSARALTLISIALLSLSWAPRLSAAPRAQLERALGQAEREALYTRISPQVAEVHRAPIYPQGVHPVGARDSLGRGLWLTEGLLLTAEAWLARSPAERAVSLSVTKGHTRSPHDATTRLSDPLELLYHSPKTGLALLFSPAALSQLPPSERLRLARRLLSQRIEDSPAQLSAPRTLWALTDDSHKATPVMLVGRGAGAEAYYWTLSAPMRWGDPLFDAEGRWVSVACAHGRLLPPEALRDFVKELP